MLSYFLTVKAPQGARGQLLEFFHKSYLPLAMKIPGVLAIRAFVASSDEVPYFDDVGAPDLSLQLLLASAGGLTASHANGALADFRQIADIECIVNHQLFELIEQPLPNLTGLAYGEATQSFAVRYYTRDTLENTSAFRTAYLKGHPDALANFPAVRRIFCYVPVAWNDPTDIQNSNSIIGNEVVFDTVDELRTAFLSPAMGIAGQHSRTLPRYNGWNTHFLMKLVHEWIAR